ncbi:four-carbon acid sugar kinase family protein [Ornithinimicrobium sp. Y1694]|uniref:four-carbon acid sugar kinase family protein n=1 Tax=Ornithinimicrobium sp. Y1694 TaxID=3418590 RepID=UPI003CE71717
MARALVVADDLTGANACAAGFARRGLRAVTVGRGGGGSGWGAVAEFHPRFDVVVATTDARHWSPREIDRVTREVVRAGWPVDLVCCRIDTTLRGGVGPAAAAAIGEARELGEGRVVGLCQPAHPAAGRVTVEGHQLLNGRRLEETELARDVRSPMTTSEVAAILRQDSSLTVATLPLTAVTGPSEELIAELGRLLSDPELDVIVADGITVEHLDRVAAAALQAGPDVRWVGIDPGPGSVALAGALGIDGGADAAPLLAVSGSATELTRQQLEILRRERPVHLVRPTLRDEEPLPEVDATVRDVVRAIEDGGRGEIVLLASVLGREDLLELTAEQAQAWPALLGQITRRVLQEVRVDGLYSTGGDITAAVLLEVDGQGIEIEDEVVPLAVAGEIVAGPWAGLPVVTKGGLVGGPGTAVECLDHLARSAAIRSRHVRSGVSRETT